MPDAGASPQTPVVGQSCRAAPLHRSRDRSAQGPLGWRGCRRGGDTPPMFRLSLPVATERLTLRPFTPDDLDDLHAYQSLPDVARHLFRPPLTRDQCARSLTRRAAGTAWAEDGDDLVVAVCETDGTTVVGEIVLKLASARARQAEIGWVFHPAYGGRGYATEAARDRLTRLRGAERPPAVRPSRRTQHRFGARVRAARHAPRSALRRERPRRGALGRRVRLRDTRPRVEDRSGPARSSPVSPMEHGRDRGSEA